MLLVTLIVVHRCSPHSGTTDIPSVVLELQVPATKLLTI